MLNDIYFFIAFPSDDKFRPVLRGGNDYINAVIIAVNIIILVLASGN